MSFVRLKQVKSAFEKYKQRIMAPEQKIIGFFSRDLYPFYQQKQFERWKSEGESEGSSFSFPEPKPATVKRKMSDKERKPNQYPGGRKKLVHSGTLATSVIGPLEGSGLSARGKKYHRREITNQKMKVMTTTPYASHVVDYLKQHGRRSYMEFGRRSQSEFKERIANFLRKEFVR